MTPASNGFLIRNAAQIVTGHGPVLRGSALRNIRIQYDASLYAKNGWIVAVGPAKEVESCVDGTPEVIDAAGKAVVPGFVDAHTHAVFAGDRVDEFVEKLRGVSYQDIAARGGGILSTVRATRAASKDELKELTRARLRTALEHGTTTMEVKSGYGLDLENELKMLEVIGELGTEQPVQLVPTFLGAHAVPPDCSREEYVRRVVDMLPEASTRAVFCDLFCDPSYFPVPEARLVLEAAKKLGMPLHLHAGQFWNDGGVELGLDLGVRAMAHLDHVPETTLQRLGASDAAAILLPGVSLFGHSAWPAARRLREAGGIVAIATNFNPGSCPSISMPMMIALACTGMGLSPAEALNACTVNAAYALNLEGVGSLGPGKQADLVVLDYPDYRMIPYHFGTNPVRAVVKKGRVAWRR